jgi:hypothetical protein
MITGPKVVTALNHIGANPMARMVLDGNYGIAEATSVVNFWQDYYANLKALGVLPAAEEDMDCDDFAILAWALMRISFRRTKRLRGDTTKAGVNMGVFAFEKSNGINHMINFMPSDYGVIFYEPQPQGDLPPGQPVHLTPEEINSCFAYAI